MENVASAARVDTMPRRPMEPALLDLLEDCPRDVSLWFEGLRVQTCADVCHMWHSGTETVEEYEAGDRMSADMAFKLAMMWTLASQRSAVQRDQAVQALVSERESTCPSRPVLSLETAPTDPARAPVRSMVATGLTSAVPPPRIISANADPHVKEQAVKEVKIQALFQLALEDLLDLQKLGTTVQALQDPLRLQAFKDSVMTSAQRLGVERLGALTSALKRWKRYALDKGYSVQVPFSIAAQRIPEIRFLWWTNSGDVDVPGVQMVPAQHGGQLSGGPLSPELLSFPCPRTHGCSGQGNGAMGNVEFDFHGQEGLWYSPLGLGVCHSVGSELHTV